MRIKISPVERMTKWRKAKAKLGWKAVYYLVPADLALKMSIMKRDHKLANLNLYKQF